MRLSLRTSNLFKIRYTRRVLGLQPIAYFPLNESQGRIAEDWANNNNIGLYWEVEVGNAVGPDQQVASTWLNDANTSRVRLHGDILSAIDWDLGSIMLWYKAAWTDAGTKVLLMLEKDGNNHFRMRRTGVNGYDFQHLAAATLCDVAAVNADSTWKCIIATWDTVNDRLRLYFNEASITDSDSTFGAGAGAIANGQIGANNYLGGNPADGCIKHFAIWDRELTAAEIQILLNIRGGNRSKEMPAFASNAAAALAIDTYDLSDECTHPSVIDFGTNWNGYRYWMALTPLPGGDNQFENPQIMASADGETWVEPGAIVNPIDAWPGAGFWNSDVRLVYDGTNLHCLYRSYDPGPWSGIHYRSSNDGENWGAQGDVLAIATNQCTSPACIKDGATWKLWVVDENASPNVVKYRTAAAITGAWSSPTTCTVPLPTNYEPYHIDVISDGAGGFELWVSAQETRSSEVSVALFRLTSTDGITFTNCQCVLHPDSNKWDGRFIYKASAQADGAGNVNIWYGGVDEDNVWKIGKTSI